MRQSTGFFVLALCAAATGARADVGYDLSASSLLDDSSGGSYSLAAGFYPNKWLTLSASGGHSSAGSASATGSGKFSGDSLRFGADLHSASFGARAFWSQWQDSNAFDSSATGGGIYWRHDGLQLEILGESKRFSTDYTFVNLLGRPGNATASFGGSGFGAAVSWTGAAWALYARGLRYSYDKNLQRLITISHQASTLRIPRLQALTESVLTRGAAALDSDVTFGVDRSFARSGLRLDVALSRDAIGGAQSRDYSAGWRYSFTSQFEAELTAGTTQTTGSSRIGYAGLTLTYRH